MLAGKAVAEGAGGGGGGEGADAFFASKSTYNAYARTPHESERYT